MAQSLPAWREPEAVLALARLAVAEREGVRREDVVRRLEPLHGGDRVTFFDMPRIDVSSSDIRRRVGEGRPIRYLVPDAVAEAIADRKAVDIVALDLRSVAGYTDFFVICSGNTDRQTKAIHDAIHKGLKDEHGLLPRRVEGASEARWILMDYLDVVVHVFTPDTRNHYRLESVWGDVPRSDPDPQALLEELPVESASA